MTILPKDFFVEEIESKIWKQKLSHQSFLSGCRVLQSLKKKKREKKTNKTTKKTHPTPPKPRCVRFTTLVIPCNYSPIANWDFLDLTWAAGRFLSSEEPTELLWAANCKKTLKYDKHIRALNGSILHHPQPLLVVLPGQMKLECTYSCSEL